MREWALIVLIFIALMAGGHRMDEQFSPSLKAVSWSYVKLSKAERAVLFFRNKAFRHRFLRAVDISAKDDAEEAEGGAYRP